MYERIEVISVQLEEHGLNHISGPRMLIRRLVGMENEDVLANLMNYVEPIEGYQRRKPSSKMPLSRAPDIAAPDALPARQFNALIERYLKQRDPVLKDEVKGFLLGWIENDKELEILAEDNFAVREFLPLSSELARISILGMQALSENVDHDSDWREKAERTLEKASKPLAECELKVTSGIQRLVQEAN
jgi:hexosaminidase